MMNNKSLDRSTCKILAAYYIHDFKTSIDKEISRYVGRACRYFDYKKTSVERDLVYFEAKRKNDDSIKDSYSLLAQKKYLKDAPTGYIFPNLLDKKIAPQGRKVVEEYIDKQKEKKKRNVKDLLQIITGFFAPRL